MSLVQSLSHSSETRVYQLLDELILHQVSKSFSDPNKTRSLREYCRRILGCTFSLEQPEGDHLKLMQLIQKKLLRDDSDGNLSISFSKCYEKLCSLGMGQSNSNESVLRTTPSSMLSWVLMYFLYQISLQVEHHHGSMRINSASLLKKPIPLVKLEEKLIQKKHGIGNDEKHCLVISTRKNWVNFLSNQNGYVSEETLSKDLLLLLGGSLSATHYARYVEEQDFYLVNTTCGLSVLLKGIIQQICKMAIVCRHIQKYITQDCLSQGQMYTSLRCWIQANLLQPYHQSISELTQRFRNGVQPSLLLIYRTVQPFLDLFSRFDRALIDTERKGFLKSAKSSSHTLAVLYDHLGSILPNLFTELHKPFHEMISAWIDFGNLRDSYGEFFICESTMSISDDKGTASSSNNTLWKDRFMIQASSIPYFIDRETAEKIFVLGKSKWFATTLLPYESSDSVMSDSASSIHIHDAMSIRKKYQTEAPMLLLTLRKNPSILLDQHMIAMKRYFFGERSDFIQALMDTLGPELDKPASLLFRHHLIGSFDDVLKQQRDSSNSQLSDGNIEVLKRLDVRLLKANKNDLGWDTFTLDYHFQHADAGSPTPLSSIFTIPNMTCYIKMFRLIWKLKRCEHRLSLIWRRLGSLGGPINEASHSKRSSTHLLSLLKQHRPTLRMSYSTLMKMHHVIVTVLHYVLIHVIETAWNRFHSQWNHLQDLDAYNQCHQTYLNTVLYNSFFIDPSISGSIVPNDGIPLLTRLNLMIQSIHQFDSLQSDFCNIFSQIQLGDSSVAALMRIRTDLSSCSETFKKHLGSFLQDLDQIVQGNNMNFRPLNSSLGSFLFPMYGHLITLLTFNGAP
jgi:hypothetical protein